jgi:hypothetical protein
VLAEAPVLGGDERVLDVRGCAPVGTSTRFCRKSSPMSSPSAEKTRVARAGR